LRMLLPGASSAPEHASVAPLVGVLGKPRLRNVHRAKQACLQYSHFNVVEQASWGVERPDITGFF
jgi:hypothetical protein